METLVITAIVAAAALYIVRSFAASCRQAMRQDRCCGCDGCADSDPTPEKCPGCQRAGNLPASVKTTLLAQAGPARHHRHSSPENTST